MTLVRQAIACYEQALRVFTEAEYPQDWATTQDNLGSAFAALPVGDRGENLQRAIACHEAALRVRTSSDGLAWGTTQNNLGAAYAALPIGDRAANLERAIACYEAALDAYFQAGDNPGRKEPGTGEINYRNVFRHIHGKGFAGVVGMEHGNSLPGRDGELAVIRAYREADRF